MAGNNPALTKIYDFREIGIMKLITNVEKLNDGLQRTVETKKLLNQQLKEASAPEKIKKLSEEIGKQAEKQKRLTEEQAKARTELKQFNAEMVRAAKLQLAERNSIERAQSLINKWTNEKKKLNLATAEGTRLNEAYNKAIQKSNEFILRNADVESKRFKNIGNYSSATEGLRNSINQLTREAPAFANSVQTGFLALSNNLPILADSIKRIRTENVELQKQGQPTKSVLGSLASAFFSWQTAMSAGITILTLYGPQIVDFIGSLFRGKQAMDGFIDRQQALNTVMKNGIDGAKEEIGKLELLYAKTQDVTLSMKERKKASDDLQEGWPLRFANMTDEYILAGKAAGAYYELRDSIVATAKARAAEEELSKRAGDRLDKEQELIKTLNVARADATLNKGKTRNLSTLGSGLNPTPSTRILSVDESDRIRQQRLNDAEAALNEFRALAKKEDDILLGIVRDQNAKGQSLLDDRAKQTKEYLAEEKKRQAEEKKAAREAINQGKKDAKEKEDSDRIIREAQLNLLGEHQRALMERLDKFEADKKKLVNASNEEMKLVEDSYLKDINSINNEFYSKHLKSLDEYLKDVEAKEDEAMKKRVQAKGEERDEILDFEKYMEQSITDTQAEAKNRINEIDTLHYNQRKNAMQSFYNDSLDLLMDFYRQQSNAAAQQADERYQDVLEFQDGEKQKRLAQAQSAAEKEAIEREYDEKAKAAERQRNIERQAIARKQLTVEFALASIKAISTSTNIYEGLAKEAIVFGEYLLAMNALNSQKFEEGGQVPTSTGGDISGPSHAAGGVPFGFEAEGGEMAIINKNSTMDNGLYSFTGTPRQIASAINEIGGGVRFAPGAVGSRKFEYGGMLGANLSAPQFRGYYQNNTGASPSDNEAYMQTMKAITAMNGSIRNIKVSLDLHSVTRAQNDYTKQTRVGTI